MTRRALKPYTGPIHRHPNPRRDALLASLGRIYHGVMRVFAPYCAMLTLLILWKALWGAE